MNKVITVLHWKVLDVSLQGLHFTLTGKPQIFREQWGRLFLSTSISASFPEEIRQGEMLHPTNRQRKGENLCMNRSTDC